MKYPPRSDTSFLNQSPLCRNFHPAILMKFSNWKIHTNNFWELVWALSKISSYNHHSLLFLLAFPEASGLANLSTLVSTTIVNARKVWLKAIVWKSKINLGDIARAGADNFSAYFCGQIPGMVRSIFVLDYVSYPTSGPARPPSAMRFYTKNIPSTKQVALLTFWCLPVYLKSWHANGRGGTFWTKSKPLIAVNRSVRDQYLFLKVLWAVS